MQDHEGGEKMEKILCQIPKSEHPRPDWQRESWYSLNGQWEFQFDPEDKGLLEEWFIIGAAPFDREIMVPFSWASPLSGIGENRKGIGWYKRAVKWRPLMEDSRIFLRFGAVDYYCDVWVNNTKVGSHQGGYGDFEFDVTHVWKRDGQNWIVVRAEDMDHSFQTRGKQGYGEIRGIWQSVWLEERPGSYIKWACFRTRLDGQVEASFEIYGGYKGRAELRFSFDQGQVRGLEKVELAEGIQSFKASFKVPNPRLWSPEAPYLYEGTVELLCEDGSLDRVSTYFGIREIGTKKFEGREYPWITLNEKPVFLSGTLDQAFNPKGYFTYPSDEEMQDEIWRLKRLGLNFVRIHIKPEEPRKLYWADRLGILVMEDMPCFWGEPDEAARAAYESEIKEVLRRDINHPSIISWVLFNETWGLFSRQENGERAYTLKTQEWVRGIYRWAKGQDPTRLIEDNSPCNHDHVESDLNTWHFYINGYKAVRDHIQNVVDSSYPGSAWNYIGGNTQGEIPLLNSECGAVWGIEGSAGDSDIAWHYHYMVNEFRRHDKLCGFVFTEFHDVVNEFNGYYRIDNGDKDFGYQWFCPDMSLKDLHSPDFLVIDAPPCQTVACGQELRVPVLASSYRDTYHGQELSLLWELWYDSLGERKTAAWGQQAVTWPGYGVKPLTNIHCPMPQVDAVAVLAVSLVDPKGKVLTRNFTTFDVRSGKAHGLYDLQGSWISIPPSEYIAKSWKYSWHALRDHKVNGGESGFFEYRIDLSNQAGLSDAGNMEILFEAGAKMLLYKDKELIDVKPHDISYMHGAKADPGMNINSYFMTDEKRHSTRLEVLVNEEPVESLYLPDDPADSRGVLSWHYQENDRKLQEAGSYGYLQRVRIPSRLVAGIKRDGGFRLKLRVQDCLCKDEGGLALYGRNAGRYPIDILVRYW